MKVIDLYVMVSKGEQPKKFKYRDEWWAYSVDDYDFRTLKQEYRDADMPTYEYLMSIIDTSNLNDEVEIIEEEKEIEEIIILTDDTNMQYVSNEKHEKISYSIADLLFANKINELVREINKIKKEGK